MQPGDIAPMVVMITIAICVTAIIIPVGRAFARRIEGRSSGPDERVTGHEANVAVAIPGRKQQTPAFRRTDLLNAS